MGSYARLGPGKSGSQTKETWSDHDWPDVFAAKDRLDIVSPPNSGSGISDWSVGGRCFQTRPAEVEASRSISWHPDRCSEDCGQEGFSADQLLDELRRAMERNPEGTRAAVAQMVTFLTPRAAVEPASARGGLAPWQKRKVDRYLKQNLDRPVRLNAVAEQVALSVSYFSRAFKETFGTTPHMHMLRLRLELAKRLMLTTEDALSQIALACGLADQAHLSKLFRRVVGETPSAWRRRNLTDAQVEARTRHSVGAQFALPATGSGGIVASP